MKTTAERKMPRLVELEAQGIRCERERVQRY